MRNEAGLATLRVHKRDKPRAVVPLGDLDEEGTYLGHHLRDSFGNRFFSKNTAGDETISCLTSTLVDKDLQLVLEHGQTGIAADIFNSAGDPLFHQAPGDVRVMRCLSLIRLPRNATYGYMALSVTANPSPMNLTVAEMVKRFDEAFPDLTLVVTPYIPGPAFAEMLNRDRLEIAKISKFDKSSDLKDSRKGVTSDYGRIGLHQGAATRGKQRLEDLIDNGQPNGRGFQLEGLLEPDTPRVEVLLGDGRNRAFAFGKPLPTASIEPSSEDGEPTDESIFAELGRLISELP